MVSQIIDEVLILQLLRSIKSVAWEVFDTTSYMPATSSRTGMILIWSR